MRPDESTLLLEPITAESGAAVVTPAKIISRAIAPLPRPHGDAERAQFTAVIDALKRLDGQQAREALAPADAALPSLDAAYHRLPIFAAVTVAIEALRAADIELPGCDAFLAVVRQQVRAVLCLLPTHGIADWIVPAAEGDRTLAHVVALTTARLGQPQRLWVWDGLPDHGRFALVGRDADRHSAIHHHRCDGVLDLVSLVRRLPAV